MPSWIKNSEDWDSIKAMFRVQFTEEMRALLVGVYVDLIISGLGRRKTKKLQATDEHVMRHE
jgi:hypothetical protein